jgi:hypothetical protein
MKDIKIRKLAWSEQEQRKKAFGKAAIVSALFAFFAV